MAVRTRSRGKCSSSRSISMKQIPDFIQERLDAVKDKVRDEVVSEMIERLMIRSARSEEGELKEAIDLFFKKFCQQDNIVLDTKPEPVWCEEAERSFESYSEYYAWLTDEGRESKRMREALSEMGEDKNEENKRV